MHGGHIFATDGIGYSVAVQYPDANAEEALPVIEMADRYPFGPDGTLYKGEAL